ncbi:MAG: DUF2182 domain-containing protein [Acidimicrobiales bacterium]
MPADLDTPGRTSSRDLLPWYVGLLLTAGLAWVVTITWATPMGAASGAMGLPLVAFLPVWVVMMAAMMFPSVAPMAIIWIRSVAGRATVRARVWGIVSFLAGYLVAWLAFGVVVYLALVETDRLVRTTPAAAPWVGAVVFGVAGAYQLSPLKGACLRHCRSPVGSLVHYAGFTGRTRDLRVGVHHGLYCVGCCWGLMILLVAVGAMNLPAMVALTGVVMVEKVWRHGATYSKYVGALLLAAAALAPFLPALLPGLRPGPMSM